MIAVDTNILIYAHRAETERHAAAHARLTALAESPGPWALPVFCLAEFVRVVTHRRVFSPPSTLAETLAFIDVLVQSPSLRLLLPGNEFPRWLRLACEQADARGNLAFDAQIAAVCMEQGITRLLTHDRDFARFRELTLEDLTVRA